MKKLLLTLLIVLFPILVNAESSHEFVDSFLVEIPNAAASYIVADNIGGLLFLEDVDRQKSLSGRIITLTITDESNQHPNYFITFFKEIPTSGSTIITDNLREDIDPTDIDKVQVVRGIGADLAFVNTGVVIAVNQDLAFRITSGTRLYFSLRTNSNVTYPQADSLRLKVTFTED